MHSLSERPLPTLTVPPRGGVSLPKTIALYTTLAFSISTASTALSTNYENQISLKPATITGPRTTNTVLLEQLVAIVPPRVSWLESTITALMADLSNEELAKIPDKFVADVDSHM